jgi:hypothetical protein
MTLNEKAEVAGGSVTCLTRRTDNRRLTESREG